MVRVKYVWKAVDQCLTLCVFKKGWFNFYHNKMTCFRYTTA